VAEGVIDSNRTVIRRFLCAGVLVVAVPTVAGCGRLNRTATINQTTQAPGATTAAALQRQLAKEGVPNARVSCAKSMIVNLGTRTSCRLAGARTKDIVRFTFSSSRGAIDPASVGAS
jgi:hypothetical protein